MHSKNCSSSTPSSLKIVTFLGQKKYLHENKFEGVVGVKSSVADPDPDPDPVGSGHFWSPGSFIHKKTRCYSNFLIIKLSKIQFRPNNFLIFDFKWHNNFYLDFKCHIMVRFGEKMP